MKKINRTAEAAFASVMDRVDHKAAEVSLLSDKILNKERELAALQRGVDTLKKRKKVREKESEQCQIAHRLKEDGHDAWEKLSLENRLEKESLLVFFSCTKPIPSGFARAWHGAHQGVPIDISADRDILLAYLAHKSFPEGFGLYRPVFYRRGTLPRVRVPAIHQNDEELVTRAVAFSRMRKSSKHFGGRIECERISEWSSINR